jgi:beta-phosphoglucomutase
MKKYKAVLFDFDGVIGRTMDDNYRAWRSALSKFGVRVDKAGYFLLEGMSTKKIAEHFLGGGRKAENAVKDAVRAKERHYAEHNSFRLYAGTDRLLSSLKKGGYRLGLVSGASSERLKASLRVRTLKKFDAVVSGDMVGKCKPHPEPYLTAARRLAIAPKDCLAVENAPLGIASAKRAKMGCLAVRTTLDGKFLRRADKVVAGLSELKKILCV